MNPCPAQNGDFYCGPGNSSACSNEQSFVLGDGYIADYREKVDEEKGRKKGGGYCAREKEGEGQRENENQKEGKKRKKGGKGEKGKAHGGADGTKTQGQEEDNIQSPTAELDNEEDGATSLTSEQEAARTSAPTPVLPGQDNDEDAGATNPLGEQPSTVTPNPSGVPAGGNTTTSGNGTMASPSPSTEVYNPFNGAGRGVMVAGGAVLVALMAQVGYGLL